MTPAVGGKFCDHCTKVVRDLTHASQEEIKTAYENAGGNLCGRFRRSQLAFVGPIPEVKVPLRNVIAAAEAARFQALARFALAFWICFAPFFSTAQSDSQKGVKLIAETNITTSEHQWSDTKKMEVKELTKMDSASVPLQVPTVPEDSNYYGESVQLVVGPGEEYKWMWNEEQLGGPVIWTPGIYVVQLESVVSGWTVMGDMMAPEEEPVQPLAELPAFPSPIVPLVHDSPERLGPRQPLTYLSESAFLLPSKTRRKKREEDEE